MVDSVFLPVHPSPPWSVHRTLICSSAVSLCLLKAGTPQDCQYWSVSGIPGIGLICYDFIIKIGSGAYTACKTPLSLTTSLVRKSLLFFPLIFILLVLFLTALGLGCCTKAFSSCSKQGLLFVAVLQLLIVVVSLVAKYGL